MQSCGTLPEHRLAQGQRQVAEFLVRRADRDRQSLCFLAPLEGLAATAVVFRQRVGDEMSQGAEFEDLLVATPSLALPKVVQPGVGQGELENPPNRVRQWKLGQNRCGEDFVVHDDGSEEDSSDYQEMTCDNVFASQWEPQRP